MPPVLDVPRRGIVIEANDLGHDVYHVVFDSVDSIDAAEALAGCSCLVRRVDLPEGFDACEEDTIVGYAVIDEVLGDIGTVVEVIDNKAQRLISVDGAMGEVLVPFVDAIVLAIDDDAETVRTRVPRGLVEC
ncbi:ribosome maturation factor RimM [Raoultibacter phocaeensis]|uniref:ribosome maturation factor RimM n=1 Tax=Raoultibacter phocaeensis TaxID=2479841 RepID=UPI0021083434|nr:16S rRNA processing protein RimM [Raoultibacter phocaeensis]